MEKGATALPTGGSRGGDATAQRAIAGVAWLSAGNAARAALKIAVLAVLARLLTPDAFGLVGAAMFVVWLSTIAATLGVGPSLVQLRQLEPTHVSTAFVASTALGLAIGASVFLLASSIAAAFRMPALAPVMQALSLAFPIAGVAVVAECMLQRALRFDVIARAELFSYAIGYGLVGIGMAALGAGVWALVGAELTKALVKASIFLRAMPPVRPLRFGGREFAQLARFGWRYTLGNVAIFLGLHGDAFVVGRLMGATALGLWGRAAEIMLVPAQAFGVVLDKVLFATLSRAQDDRERLAVADRRAAALVALLVLPTTAATLVLTPEIVRALLGPGWDGVVAPLRILAIAMHLRVGYMIGQVVANASGAAGATAWRNALHACLVVAGAWIGHPFGLPGVAAGVTAAIMINYVLVLRLGLRVTGLPLVAFLGAHGAAAKLALLVGAEAWAVAAVARGAGAPAIVALAAAALLVSASLLAIVRLAPGRLGPDGAWLIEALRAALPAGLRRFLPPPR